MTARRASHNERAGRFIFTRGIFYQLTIDFTLLLFPAVIAQKVIGYHKVFREWRTRKKVCVTVKKRLGSA